MHSTLLDVRGVEAEASRAVGIVVFNIVTEYTVLYTVANSAGL